MLSLLPPEVLSIVTEYLESVCLLKLVASGDLLLIYRLTEGGGCESLQVIAPYNIKEGVKTIPKSLNRFRRLKSLVLRPEDLALPGNFKTSPGVDWIQATSAMLSRLSIHSSEPMKCFLRPNIASLESNSATTHQILVQWASLFRRQVNNDPWLPLEQLMPNLKSLEISTRIMSVHREHESSAAFGHAIWRFLCHLPPTLRELRTNYIYTGTGKWAAALPPSLEVWHCPPASVRCLGWAPPQILQDIDGNIQSTNGIDPARLFGLLTSQVINFPTTLTELDINSHCEVEALAHFPSLQILRSRRLIYTLGASKTLPICAMLPKTLTELRADWIDELGERLNSPVGAYPSQLLSLYCAFVIAVPTLLPLIPPSLTYLNTDAFMLDGEHEEIALLPRTLTSLMIRVRFLRLYAFIAFPPKLRALRVEYNRSHDPSHEAGSTLDLSLFPFLSTIESLTLLSHPPSKLKFPIFDQMPHLLELCLNNLIIDERDIPFQRSSRLRKLTVHTVIVTGHGLCETPVTVPKEEWDGLMTKGLLMDTFRAWLRSSSRVSVTEETLDVQLERLPPGTTALKHLTWKTSEIDFLPSTLVELSGSFEIHYQDIPRLPKSVTVLRDPKLIIDDKGAKEILTKISNPTRLHLSLPYDLFKECCLGTDIIVYTSAHGTNGTASLSNDALSKLWPEISTLVFSTDFPLLTSECLAYIPRSLTKLRICYPALSTLIWLIIPELKSLTSLTAIPRPNLIIEDWSLLPTSLQTLELNYDDRFGVSDVGAPQPTLLLEIPPTAIQALPRTLTQLHLLWPNTISDTSIQDLPRSLQHLKLDSPMITDPPFHTFPASLVGIQIKSLFRETRNLLEYLKKKRKSLKVQ